ncbi:phage tail protein [Stenotrophomonas sp. 24(2023)]|uniref:host specificity protein J n=1 Tax=Stenotrophomonas sp. 24(2023) TaxID=3068324 RepID=UPI0027DF6782|nr:phage tail protein [Stenotrophomonas sp. 24(2023)]WMJ71321.1 phage tail protein [Stenotrophomonas sp. 24(2023)]
MKPIIQTQPRGHSVAAAALAGAKKGKSNARTPVETPDSLRSMAVARVIDLASEGEIRGLVAGQQSVFLDQVPVQNPDGTLNFSGVQVETRSGTQDQEHIAGFPSIENEVGVNVELRSDSPIVRTVSGADLSAVRIRFAVPALQKTNTENGDTEGYRIVYAVDLATDGGPFSTVLTDAFSGKTTSQYERSRRIDLPSGSQWQVRIRRLTANANSSTVADTVNVLSMTEIIDAKLRYPNCALAAVQVDASQFQNIPSRAYQLWGRVVRVPSNYDPLTRSYTGVWDGTFKSSWTNNPAWVFFDIVTNDRFGLGHRIPLDWVDKWRLYQIARYCDEPVSDGQGGKEPRFTCSLYLQTRAEAYRVLQDMASMFRGISFYASGQVMAAADMPKDPVQTYSQANVVDGRFRYSGSGRKARHTVALVSWSDPEDFGRQKVEVVQHLPGVARYGINQMEVTAVGCHSRSQAQRVGNHILYTEMLETETVSFSVGLDALGCMPGDIIQVADANRAGRRNGGRIRSAGPRTLVLDKAPDQVAAGDILRATLPNGHSEARTVQSVSGDTLTVTAPWSAVPVAQSVWALESPELALQQFRVLAITEGDGVTYEITALKHVPGKFAAIDDGTRLEPLPISIVPPSVQPPPANVRMASRAVVDQGIATSVLTIEWDAADKAIAYDVEWRRGDLNWVRIGRVGTQSAEVRGIYAGQYLARVRAVNALGAVSQPALSALTAIAGKTTPPPALASLACRSRVFGIDLAWAFPTGAGDTERTELWHATSPDRSQATKLGDFAYPQATHQMNGLAAGARFWFWGRLVDRSGNVGPWYPAAAGVMGEASSNAADYDAYFAGRINESALGQQLQQTLQRVGQVAPLVWDAAASYAPGQTVIHLGRIWSWQGTAAGNETPPGTRWKDIGQAVAEAGAVVGRLDSLALDVATIDGKVTAQGEKVDGLFAQVSDHSAGEEDYNVGENDASSGAITVYSVMAEKDAALARRVDTVEAQIDGVPGKIEGVSAAVQQVSQAVVNLDGKVSATYTVKAQITSAGQIYMAGMGLGVEQQPDGSYQSQILMQADRFALFNKNSGQVSAPFVVQGGQTFINQAFIANGTIQNAMIGDVIQSNAVGIDGQPRWKLDKNGTLTMNGAGNGGRLTINDNVINVYDSNGQVRVRMGIW